MRKHLLSVAVLALASTTVSFSADSDDPTVIRRALEEKYPASKLTSDHTNLIEVGSALILRIDNLRTSDVLLLGPVNTYRDGKFHAFGLPRPAVYGPDHQPERWRTFVAGDRFWVTKIGVQPNNIAFDVCSDDIHGVRYRATIKFPFDRNSPMTTAAILAKVDEVFEQSDPIQNSPRN